VVYPNSLPPAAIRWTTDGQRAVHEQPATSAGNRQEFPRQGREHFDIGFQSQRQGRGFKPGSDVAQGHHHTLGLPVKAVEQGRALSGRLRL